MSTGIIAEGNVPIPPRWQALGATERRVLGVLVEKAKTTPDQYPLSLNAIVSGSNQKSNRHPIMNLQPEQVESAVEKLRMLGAVGEVQGGGRVPRYRHYMKDWLGVDGNELAIMTELLLRGDQTVGELRGRAARMGTIPDIAALMPMLSSLKDRNLVVYLTPAGRGQVVSHNLYTPSELERLHAACKNYTPPAGAGDSVESYVEPVGSASIAAMQPMGAAAPAAIPAAQASASSAQPSPAPVAAGQSSSAEIAALRAEVAELKAEVARLKKDVEDLWASVT